MYCCLKTITNLPKKIINKLHPKLLLNFNVVLQCNLRFLKVRVDVILHTKGEILGTKSDILEVSISLFRGIDNLKLYKKKDASLDKLFRLVSQSVTSLANARNKISTQKIYQAAAKCVTCRFVLKALTWRAVACTDTFGWGFWVSGNIGQAVGVAGSEIFTKVPLYVGHEWLWSKVAWGKETLSKDAVARAFTKAVTYRILGSADTFVLSFLFTGHVKQAAAIASYDAVSKIVLYGLHDMLWKQARHMKDMRAAKEKRALKLHPILMRSELLRSGPKRGKNSWIFSPKDSKYKLPTMPLPRELKTPARIRLTQCVR